MRTICICSGSVDNHAAFSGSPPGKSAEKFLAAGGLISAEFHPAVAKGRIKTT